MLLAMGVSYNRLDIPGAERFEGAGLYYGAAMTESASCVSQHIFVVGGANSAGQAAIHFAKYAAKVTVLVRGESLADGMSRYLVDEISRVPNIEVRVHTRVLALYGDQHLERIELSDDTTGIVTDEAAQYVFTFIGARPRTGWLGEIVACDSHGFVLTGPDLPHAGKSAETWPLERDPYLLETSVPGVFAAGDTRAQSIKRVASGVGEGAMAVALIHRFPGIPLTSFRPRSITFAFGAVQSRRSSGWPHRLRRCARRTFAEQFGSLAERRRRRTVCLLRMLAGRGGTGRSCWSTSGCLVTTR